MPKLKVLSAKKLFKIFKSFGFEIIRQSGSHVIICRKVFNGNQVLTIPKHKELKKATIRDIYNQACKHLSDEELREHFFTK